MTRRLIVAVAALIALAAIGGQKAEASTQRMCISPSAGTAAGPGRWVAPGSSTAYSVDTRGCALVAAADQADARSAGFRSEDVGKSIVVTGITAQDFSSITLPPSAYIRAIVVQNTTANAVTGGVKIGTTAGGTDVVSALTCGANCLVHVTDSALSKRVFSTTASQNLSIDAVTGWNSANLTVTVIYGYF